MISDDRLEEYVLMCRWCKNRPAISYVKYDGCCSLHCRDLAQNEKELQSLRKELADTTDNLEISNGRVRQLRKFTDVQVREIDLLQTHLDKVVVQNKALLEDGERLAKRYSEAITSVERFAKRYGGIRAVRVAGAEEILSKHRALMERIEKET